MIICNRLISNYNLRTSSRNYMRSRIILRDAYSHNFLFNRHVRLIRPTNQSFESHMIASVKINVAEKLLNKQFTDERYRELFENNLKNLLFNFTEAKRIYGTKARISIRNKILLARNFICSHVKLFTSVQYRKALTFLPLIRKPFHRYDKRKEEKL